MHVEQPTPRLDRTKELRLLLAFFGDAKLPKVEYLAADQVPPPYHELLVHHHHMTETLESYFGGPLIVEPYEVCHRGDVYGRKLDLLSARSRIVVMTGVMLFNFRFASDEVRKLILAEKVPLGQILREHHVLREVSSHAYLRVDKDDPLIERFGLYEPRDAYGRLATIFCDGQPAVDLLEVVHP